MSVLIPTALYSSFTLLIAACFNIDSFIPFRLCSIFSNITSNCCSGIAANISSKLIWLIIAGGIGRLPIASFCLFIISSVGIVSKAVCSSYSCIPCIVFTSCSFIFLALCSLVTFERIISGFDIKVDRLLKSSLFNSFIMYKSSFSNIGYFFTYLLNSFSSIDFFEINVYLLKIFSSSLVKIRRLFI